MEFVIVIAVLVTVTVATGVATQLYEMKIESNFKKDLLVNNAQIVVDKDGKQKIYLYDEEGALIKMDRGAEQYSKYIIKQMKKQTQLLQDEMKKAQKEAEKAQKQTEKYLKESEILKRELEKNKEEITKYKAQYEADVLKSLKSGYSSESSGGLSRDEADLPLISFIKTTNLDGKSVSEIHESLEQVKTKNEKIQIKSKSKFFSLSTAGAASREEHSGTEESYIDNHKSRGSSHSFSDTTSRGESSGENTSQPRHRAHSISRLFKSIDEKDENDPSEADRGSGSLTSTESRSSLQKNPESKGILHKLISSASPGVSRRELPKDPTDHKSKLDATKKRIEKLKGSAGFSRKSKTDQEGSESQTESLKIDSVKLASSMEPELHHKSEKLSYHDGAKHRTSEGRPHRRRAEEKNYWKQLKM